MRHRPLVLLPALRSPSRVALGLNFAAEPPKFRSKVSLEFREINAKFRWVSMCASGKTKSHNFVFSKNEIAKFRANEIFALRLRRGATCLLVFTYCYILHTLRVYKVACAWRRCPSPKPTLIGCNLHLDYNEPHNGAAQSPMGIEKENYRDVAGWELLPWRVLPVPV